jgi:hypothetical protein
MSILEGVLAKSRMELSNFLIEGVIQRFKLGKKSKKRSRKKGIYSGDGKR